MKQAMTTITTRPCFLCGRASVEEVTTTQAQALAAGGHVQTVMPERPAPERELFITGTHPTCWEQMFGPSPQ